MHRMINRLFPRMVFECFWFWGIVVHGSFSRREEYELQSLLRLGYLDVELWKAWLEVELAVTLIPVMKVLDGSNVPVVGGIGLGNRLNDCRLF